MKNAIKISLTTLGTLAILGTSSFAITGTVNAPNGLVLREEASKTANPITTLNDKIEVDIVEKSGEWYKVTYNSQEGYLFAEYVETDEEVNQPTEKPEEQTTTDNNIQVMNKLKVYNMPLISSTVMDEIDPEAEITIIKEITNWSYVSSGEIQGWVRTYAIKGEIQTEVPTEPSEETVTEPEEPTEEQEKPEEPTVSEPEESEEPEEENTYDEPSNSTQTETSSSATKGYIAVDSATVRKEATTESEVVTYLIKGTSFKIVAETEEWYKIEYTDIEDTVYEGYIYKPLTTLN